MGSAFKLYDMGDDWKHRVTAEKILVERRKEDAV
ncbi:MAG: plasmid pRiA4b ORF-3 family protein [Lachnospiraceae bacterium]|nr:plasmid pRiA4b ORF-3 family protein [Lachnospiraceae bacterium]